MEQPGLIAARALVYGAMLPAAGLPLYALAARRPLQPSRAWRGAVVLLAALAALASLWWLLESVGAMADLPLAQLDQATVMAVASATPLGLALVLRGAALALLAGTVLARGPPVLAGLAGLAALGTLALTGHAGASEGLPGTMHRLADGAHLAAAACWIGALLVFVRGSLQTDRAEPLIHGLARFARVGSVLVAVLAITGLVNAWLIAGPALLAPTLAGSDWRQLLLFKLCLFAVMLGCAGLNRWWLVPALERGEQSAPTRLRLSLSCELAAGLAILLLVAQLGTLDPSG